MYKYTRKPCIFIHKTKKSTKFVNIYVKTLALFFSALYYMYVISLNKRRLLKWVKSKR
mgnify:CR=1 FL=1